MSNDFYNNSSTPVNRSTLSSALIRTEFASIAAGFDKLPPMTGNGDKLVAINTAGTALTVFDIHAGGAVGTNVAY